MPAPISPLCIACGALIGYEEIFGGFAYCRVTGKMDFESPLMWGSFNRAIYKAEKDSPYQVSGIGRFGQHSYALSVPSNINEVFFDNPFEPYEGTVEMSEVNFVNSYGHDSPYPHGYRVHMWCWSLIKKIIGEPAEQNLELLLETLGERWREDPFEVQGCTRKSHGIRELSWCTPELLTDQRFQKDRIGYTQAKTFDQIRRIDEDVTKNIISLRDPYKGSDIRKLISNCVLTRAREGMKRKTRRWCSKPSSSAYRDPLGLPLDVEFLILDNLDYKDIRSVLLAFGWQIPDSYWRTRYPRDIIHELEEMRVSSSTEIDWKSLCLTTEEMLETVPELQNRQRIFRILRGTKELFDAKMDSHLSVS